MIVGYRFDCSIKYGDELTFSQREHITETNTCPICGAKQIAYSVSITATNADKKEQFKKELNAMWKKENESDG